MSFAGRLVHRLAIIAATTGDPNDVDDLDDYGHVTELGETVTAVRGLVQPRTVKEITAISQAGAAVGDHVIFLLPTNLPGNAYLVDADEDGVPLAAGRRFDVVGVRSFEFGRSPHLEVDVRVVGSQEGAAAGS